MPPPQPGWDEKHLAPRDQEVPAFVGAGAAEPPTQHASCIILSIDRPGRRTASLVIC